MVLNHSDTVVYEGVAPGALGTSTYDVVPLNVAAFCVDPVSGPVPPRVTLR